MNVVTQFDITPPPAQVSTTLYDIVSTLPVSVRITRTNYKTIISGVTPLARRIQSLCCSDIWSCDELSRVMVGINVLCNLTSLRMSYCYLNAEYIQELSDGLCSSGCRLEKLDVSNNELYTSGATALVELFRRLIGEQGGNLRPFRTKLYMLSRM